MYSLLLKLAKQFKSSLSLFALLFLLVIPIYADTNTNDDCSNLESVPSWSPVTNGVNMVLTGTLCESGGGVTCSPGNDQNDYYTFVTPNTMGTLNFSYSANKNSSVFITSGACANLTNNTYRTVNSATSGNFTLNSTGTNTVLLRFLRNTNNALTNYDLHLTFVPFIPPSLSITNTSTTEGNSGTKNMSFTVTQSAVSAFDTNVSFTTSNGTATAGSDYVAVSNQTVTIPAGSTTATVPVTINGDTLYESNETFTVTLSSPINATIATGTATGTINNDDTMPTLSISNASTTEGNTGTKNLTFTITQNTISGMPTTVNFSASNGTATSGSDYVAVSNRTLTIPAGSTSITTDVTIYGDTTYEPDETFTVTLTNPTNATIATATAVGTITNDDIAPSFFISDANLTEGNSGYQDMNFTVTLSFDANATVDYATSNGTALAGSDYTATNGTLTFTAGGPTTKTISVPIIGDTLVEFNETFRITLSNPSGATITTGTATGTIINDDILPSYCDDHNLSDGFHIVNPFNDINKSIEIYCYNNKDYIAIPIKNDSNNFVFNNNVLTNTNYYDTTNNTRTDFQAIEINAYTLKVETNSSIRSPQTINAPTSFQTMGSSFSNINLTGTPFAIDWANTTISNCTQAKLRTAYYGQDVKINSLDYDSKAICNIDSMQLKLLNDYRYLEYEGAEVLKKSCKTMAEALPTSFLASSSIQGHYWISPFSNARNYGATNIKSDSRPIVAYCWYQTDLDWVWTFSLAMDGKATNTKDKLLTKSDTCSEFGLFPFVANKEDTFERVRQFLYNNKSQWVNYTGTINEKIQTFNGTNNSYYLASEQNSLIWPYGSFGVYYPSNGSSSWRGSSDTNPGSMSGSPMHNISSITSDYNRTGEFYSYGRYSNTDTISTPTNVYEYKDTMGAKGWVSILGSADLNKTNEWFISRTGAGENIIGTTVYFEPNGNYTANAWLNFLFDDNGRVRHNDDWGANYAYYDYMCMSEDNYDFTTRYGLIAGPFKAIEHSVASGSEIANTALTTKIVNDTLHFDIALLTDNLGAVQADKNISVGIFLDDTYMVGSTETPRDIHYFGDIKMNGSGTFNSLKATGRFELPASSWPLGVQTWSSANKRLFFKFKYCSRSDYEWTQCWTQSGITATCIAGQEAYCKTADSNDFAIRPKNFDFSITGTSPYKAGVGYSTTFGAKDYNNNATSNYNEAIPLTYSEAKSGCLTGNFDSNLTSMLFINGTKNIPSLSYSEVGVINIKIQETLGSEFALVDASDTSSAQRLITPYDQNWSYTPDHFALTGSSFNNYASGFTYLSSDLNMSADLNLTIVAQNLSNITTQNYNSACYSKTTYYALSYTPLVLSPSTALTRINYVETNTSTSGNLAINNTWNIASIPNTIFSTDNNGTGKLNIKVNFDRNDTKSVNPFNFTARDINITDIDGIKGGKDLNQSTTFYYGRAHAPDYRFSGNSGTATMYYEVYAKDLNLSQRVAFGITGNQGVDSVNWYQNALHVNTAGTTNPSSATITIGAQTNAATSSVVLTHTPPHVGKVNLGSSPWLIYYPTDFTVEFYSAGSWAGAGFVKEGQPNATDTNTTVGEFIHKSIPVKANRRMTW